MCKRTRDLAASPDHLQILRFVLVDHPGRKNAANSKLWHYTKAQDSCCLELIVDLVQLCLSSELSLTDIGLAASFSGEKPPA